MKPAWKRHSSRFLSGPRPAVAVVLPGPARAPFLRREPPHGTPSPDCRDHGPGSRLPPETGLAGRTRSRVSAQTGAHGDWKSAIDFRALVRGGNRPGRAGQGDETGLVCLATSGTRATPRALMSLYGKRWASSVGCATPRIRAYAWAWDRSPPACPSGAMAGGCRTRLRSRSRIAAPSGSHFKLRLCQGTLTGASYCRNPIMPSALRAGRISHCSARAVSRAASNNPGVHP
jgi:hypothetical protein